MAKTLQECQSELEGLRARESHAALRVSELESHSLVLTSENTRVRKELQLVREGQATLESRALAAETELSEKKNDLEHLAREHAAQSATIRPAVQGRHAADTKICEATRACQGARRRC